jgi:hypothetical protein
MRQNEIRIKQQQGHKNKGEEIKKNNEVKKRNQKNTRKIQSIVKIKRMKN